jgi:hypothetical protein
VNGGVPAACFGRSDRYHPAVWSLSHRLRAEREHCCVLLGPGDSRKVTLPNITEEEAERKWIEESLRPKRDPNKPGK